MHPKLTLMILKDLLPLIQFRDYAKLGLLAVLFLVIDADEILLSVGISALFAGGGWAYRKYKKANPNPLPFPSPDPTQVKS